MGTELKNIVVCLDGTNNQLRAAVNTNVVRLFELLDLRDPDAQVAYYGPGVGTFSAPSAWTPLARSLSRVAGLIVGAGLRQNLGQAYSFVMATYRPGDRIFVFGFSRGAYTARALTGMLDVFGVFRPESQNLVPYAVHAYTKRQYKDTAQHHTNVHQHLPNRHHVPDRGGDPLQHADADRFFKELNQYAKLHDVHGTGHTPIHFVGLWDTVKSAGTLTRQLRWPFTRQLPHARTIRHAVSIDEDRRPFAAYLIDPPNPHHFMVDKDQDLLEVWFSGVHSDVGGMFAKGALLSNIPLKWMADEAVKAGLLVRPRKYHEIARLDGVDPAGIPHSNNRLWRLLGPGRRTVPRDALIHASVRDRVERDPEYLERLPLTPHYVCDDWRTIHHV